MEDTEDKTQELEAGKETKKISEEVFVKAPARMVRQFVRYFIEQGFQNGAEAARKAGSTAKNPNHIAYQWLKDPWVLKEIERAKEVMGRGENPLELINEEDVISKLTRIYEFALEDKKYDPALKAVELMGKHIGMFRPETAIQRREVQRAIEGNIDDERLSHLTQVLLEAKKIKKSEEGTLKNKPVVEYREE